MSFCRWWKGQETKLILTLPLRLGKVGLPFLHHNTTELPGLLLAITFCESELTKLLETKGQQSFPWRLGCMRSTPHRFIKPKLWNNGQAFLLFRTDFLQGMSENWVMWEGRKKPSLQAEWG